MKDERPGGDDQPKREASLAALNGYAARSADEWSAVGKEAMKQAQAAVQAQCYLAAEQHRKNAELAFACEHQLRRLAPIRSTDGLGHNERRQTMQPHQERVIAEKRELDERGERLHQFILSEMFGTLSVAEQGRMKRQLEIMAEYSRVLGERIVAFA